MTHFTDRLPRLALFAAVLALAACDSGGITDDLDPGDPAGGGGVTMQSVTAFPVEIDSTWGFMDADGRLTVEPQFGFADEVYGGLAAVRQGAEWGYVRENGATVVAPQFQAAGRFTGAIAPVRADGVWGYVDASGATVVTPQYDAAQEISGGFGAVREGFLWGYVDETGGVAIAPQFAAAGPFQDGLAPVQTADGWQYIDASGAPAFAGVFAEALAFSDVGLAPVREAGSDAWKFVDRTGSIVLNTSYESAQPFTEGFSRIEQDGRIGLIGPDGAFLVVPKMAEVGVFSEGLAAVRFSSRWTYVDRADGLVTMSPTFTSARPFRGGLAQITTGSGDGLKTGYIDRTGRTVWEPSN